MNLKTLTHHISTLLLTVGTCALLQACQEESVIDMPDYTLSGEDVTLTVPVALPKMDVRSRADLDQTSLNQVNSLWVRTYSAESGKATSDWIVVEDDLPTTDSEVEHKVSFKSKSGRSYIVAVANVENLGVNKSDPETSLPLSELLKEANTWQQFLDIAVIAPSTQEYVRAPQPPLTMAGCYTDINVGGAHPEPTNLSDWQNRDFQDYFIPARKGTVVFQTGAIHLRRLVSHVNFNILPGDNVDVTVNSYQVMNAPRFSWLYERPAEKGMLANFGDQATGEEDADTYYADVPQYGSQFITRDNDGASHFDFWQSENKHTGTATEYTDREKFTKQENGKPRLFTSLTGDVWTPANEASYVLVSCTVDYKDNLRVDDEGEILTSGTGGSEVTRTGEATYIIHLGYINHQASDFNCFRNVNYTYNLTVNGVNDIRLDAYAENEVYNGEEGMVVDLDNATIDIDAHYAAFNIQLKQEELSDPNFGFIIIAYENGNQYTISDANEQVVNNGIRSILDENGNTIDPKYYNWIELRATTGQNVLAEYHPRYGYNYANNEKRTFLLSDLKGNGTTTPWDNMQANQRSDENGWYTVFVNEYTYEPMFTGENGYADERWTSGARPAWMGYVNQNPRRFYIRTTQKVSPDGNSVYARSKYGISQQSLMTYYSSTTPSGTVGGTAAGSAIAVERLNETEGMNLRIASFAGGSSTDNGRWNTAQYLTTGGSASTTSVSINSANEDNRPIWDSYLDLDAPLEVGAVTGLRAQGGPELPARTIASGNPHKLPRPVSVATLSGMGYTFNDPQENNNYTIEAINACMNRNRDNNGNGRIEPDELRWYVPAMDKYLQMMLGEASLPSPVMDFESVSQLPHYTYSGYGNNKYNFRWSTNGNYANDYCSRYMIISSNEKLNVMWLMEGTSTSLYAKITEWAGTEIRPWQIRCVRNLGTNLGGNILENDRVGTAFAHDEANRTFRMSYYDLASIRTNPYTANGPANIPGNMPIHTITSSYNSMYYGFEYASKDDRVPNTTSNITTMRERFNEYINNNPCDSLYGAGWRIPNQEELTLMRNTGVLTSTLNNTTWISCTVGYFNTSGVGSSTVITDKPLLLVTKTQGNQLTSQTLNDALNASISEGIFIRCVRDKN